MKEELLSVVGGVDAAGAVKELSEESTPTTVERPEEGWEEPAPAAPCPEAEGEEPSQANEETEWEAEVEGTEVLDDPVRMYLREIGKVHLLTSRDERVLARKMEGGRHVEKLERALLEAEGRPLKAWEVCCVLLRRLGKASLLVGSLERTWACPAI